MTMTDAELAEIRARAEAAQSWEHLTPTLIALTAHDIPALLDELAAARDVLREAESWVMRGWQRDRIVAYLHSATEDADDRTT